MNKKSFSWFCFSVGVFCLVASSRTLAQGESPRVEWERTFGGSRLDRSFSVQQTSDGGYIVTGFSQTWGPRGQARDCFLIKMEAGGGPRPWLAAEPQNLRNEP